MNPLSESPVMANQLVVSPRCLTLTVGFSRNGRLLSQTVFCYFERPPKSNWLTHLLETMLWLKFLVSPANCRGASAPLQRRSWQKSPPSYLMWREHFPGARVNDTDTTRSKGSVGEAGDLSEERTRGELERVNVRGPLNGTLLLEVQCDVSTFCFKNPSNAL